MFPAFLFLLILSVMDVSLSAPTVHEDQSDESMDFSEILPRPKETPMLEGDVAIPDASIRNADPCTATGCKWPKTGGYVYVPYFIGTEYNSMERTIITNALQDISQRTCIRFTPRKSSDPNYIHFFSENGCWSYIGKQSGGQMISLQKRGCLHHSTVQHEVFHALGFNHEQVRSDRDSYVWILTQNIEPGQEGNFYIKQTNNLQTPYDFNSIMEYSNDAFSKNGQPTIIAKSNPNLQFGHATKMSSNDILRVNRLYEC
ncbi:high choriolytic enzyme 1-like [Odontesthes bonariensis]|uniref:high choriolytic enzyme 1-like n=1 Tax=Odontesthes bonariensis TaxID=219752 RepID=UPI003F58992D